MVVLLKATTCKWHVLLKKPQDGTPLEQVVCSNSSRWWFSQETAAVIISNNQMCPRSGKDIWNCETSLEKELCLERPVFLWWKFPFATGIHANSICLEWPPVWKGHFFLRSSVVFPDRLTVHSYHCQLLVITKAGAFHVNSRFHAMPVGWNLGFTQKYTPHQQGCPGITVFSRSYEFGDFWGCAYNRMRFSIELH